MKRTTLAAIIAAFATTAQAQQTPMEICTSWGNSSEAMMNHRQAGIDIVIALMGWDVINTTVLQMIVDAYSVPIYADPTIVAEVVQDFRDVEESKCFDVFSEGA